MTETLLRAFEWKAADSAGELDGYASVFGNVDQGGDVVLPGAFRKTLADWARAKSPLPLIADHRLDTDGVIGSVVSAIEDKIGLRVRARFSSVPKAQEIRTKMIEGHLSGMSFTYEPVRSRRGKLDGKGVRFLEEVRLFEATVTPFPMNVLAVASAKTADEIEEEELLTWDLLVPALSKALEIPVDATRRLAVEDLLSKYHPAAAVAPDEGDTANVAVDTAEPAAVDTTDPDSYGARLLGIGTTPALEPPDAALGISRTLEHESATREIDALEGRIAAALGNGQTP